MKLFLLVEYAQFQPQAALLRRIACQLERAVLPASPSDAVHLPDDDIRFLHAERFELFAEGGFIPLETYGEPL